MSMLRKTLLVIGLAATLQLQAQEGAAKPSAGPPPFSEIRLQYHLALGEAEKPIAQLTSFYDSKLKELQEKLQKAGDLEGVLAVKSEREAFDEEPTKVDGKNAELKKLQSIYLDAKATRSSPYLTMALKATQSYRQLLDAQIKELTQKGKVEEAILSKQEFDLAGEELKKLQLQAKGLEVAAAAGTFGDDEPNWAQLTSIFEGEDFASADTVAGQGGGGEYRDLSPEPGILVGIQLQYSRFNNFDTVRGVLPIFLTEKGRKDGDVIRGHKKGDPKRVIAKRGYAISEVEVFGDNTAIRRAKITFARIDGDRLDLTDTYDSGWHGEYETGAFSKTTSDGRFVIGIEGVYGLGIGRVRFLLGGKE